MLRSLCLVLGLLALPLPALAADPPRIAPRPLASAIEAMSAGRWDVAQAGMVELKIFDLAGRLVKTVHAGFAAPGGYEFVWRGEDDGGRRVASGTYLVRLVAGTTVLTEKAVLVR